MVNREALAKRLAGAIGGDHVRDGAGRAREVGGRARDDAVGASSGGSPGASPVVARPGSVEETSAIFRLAREAGAKVRIRGGGTGDRAGGPTGPPDLLLETLRMSRVVEYEPGDLVAIVECGVTLAALRGTTEPKGQRLPLDPPHPDRATVGGVFASARTGPRRLRYGIPRDLTLGMRVVLPDGTVSRSGGRVVKNVAGYGLSRLWTGSFGTLAFLGEVSVRLSPIPETARLLAFPLGSLAEAGKTARALFEGPVEPAALELIDARFLPSIPPGPPRADSPARGRPGPAPGAGSLLLLVHHEGFREEVDQGVERARRAAGEPLLDLADGEAERCLASVADAALVPGDGDGFVLRAGLLPGQVAGWLDAARRALGERGIDPVLHAHLGTGIAHVHVPGPGGSTRSGSASGALAPGGPDPREVPPLEDAARLLAGLATKAGGTYRIDGLPAGVAGAVSCWGGNEESLPLSRRLKAALDPDGTLVAGGFAGGI